MTSTRASDAEDRVTVEIPRNALAVLAASSALASTRDIGEYASGRDAFDVAHILGDARRTSRANRPSADPRRDQIMAALATLVDALLDSTHGAKSSAPEYYSADRLPPGEKSWRAVLERGRRGAYDLVHVGRHVVVPAASYAEWIASSSSPRAERGPKATPSKLDRLARMGVVVPMTGSKNGR